MNHCGKNHDDVVAHWCSVRQSERVEVSKMQVNATRVVVLCYAKDVGTKAANAEASVVAYRVTLTVLYPWLRLTGARPDNVMTSLAN